MFHNSPSQGLADPEYAEELIDKVGSGLLSHGVISYKVLPNLSLSLSLKKLTA